MSVVSRLELALRTVPGLSDLPQMSQYRLIQDALDHLSLNNELKIEKVEYEVVERARQAAAAIVRPPD
jgi:hypothetical protein